MRVSERLLLVFLALIITSLSVFLGICAWYSDLLWTVYDALGESIYLRIAVSAGLLLVTVLAIRAIFVSTKKNDGVATLAASTGDGGIYINIDTVSDLANKAVKKIEGVREVRVRTSVGNDGADIKVKASMVPDAVIPEVSAAVQKSVRNDIETLCGIKVSKVTVQVDNSVQIQH